MTRVSFHAATAALIIALFALPAHAAEPTPAFPNHTAQQIADVASYGTLGAGMALEVIDAIKAPDGGHAIERVIIGHTIAYAVQGILSTVISRPRPCAPACGIDDPYRSLPSGHAAHAGATVWGDHKGWKAGFALATSGLRVAANKHHVSDSAAGFALGWSTTLVWR
jgi:membrane-associated phospholipid phosphatase